MFLRLKKLPYDCRLAHIFDPFLDQNHRLHFMVQKAQYLDQCPVKSCFPCLLCLLLLSQNLNAPHYCHRHRFMVVSFLSVIERSIKSNDFSNFNTGRKLCIAFLDLYAKILNALQSEDFLIWVFLSVTVRRWCLKLAQGESWALLQKSSFSFFPQSVRGAIIHSPLCYKQSRPHLFFRSACLHNTHGLAGYIWLDVEKVLWKA